MTIDGPARTFPRLFGAGPFARPTALGCSEVAYDCSRGRHRHRSVSLGASQAWLGAIRTPKAPFGVRLLEAAAPGALEAAPKPPGARKRARRIPP